MSRPWRAKSKNATARITPLVLCCTVWLQACGAEPPSRPTIPAPDVPASSPTHRALLIGINDYTASKVEKTVAAKATTKSSGMVCRTSWTNLHGAVNDVEAIREVLIASYAFTPEGIEVLTDEKATRQAILDTIETHLLAGAREGDVLLFYYSGHGSQMVNSGSTEDDGLDETLVPADSRLGAPDVRDKELRRLFNRILDTGAGLTVVLDNCHSGSGARGLPSGALARFVEKSCDVVDGNDDGPRPEDRGALVFSAAEDNMLAWEDRDHQGKRHGAFTLSLLWAMRSSAASGSAQDVFASARARLQAAKWYQEPVLAGNEDVRRSPLLGGRADHRDGKTVVAVEKVLKKGRVVLQGGWANGLAEGSELEKLASRNTPASQEGKVPSRLRVVSMKGLSKSEAVVVEPPSAEAGELEPGDLLEVVSWVAPQSKPLYVWIPQNGGEGLEGLPFQRAKELKELVEQNEQMAWITDPTEVAPTHVLRWRPEGWQRWGPQDDKVLFGSEATSKELLGNLDGEPANLFVQLPAPRALIERIEIGPGTDYDAVERVSDPEDAHFMLAGRYLSPGLVEHAWVRPEVTRADRTNLPPRTDWFPYPESPREGNLRELASDLQDTVLRLAKLHAWYHLSSPPKDRFPYRLELMTSDGRRVDDDPLQGGGTFSVFLGLDSAVEEVASRYVYVFSIDGHGNSVLVYPRSGSVENRFPDPEGAEVSPPPMEIDLGTSSSFDVVPPYGIDTFFLLTSAEPIPNPWVLEYPGVRERGPRGKTALEDLLSLTGGTKRGVEPPITPVSWSIDKRAFEAKEQ